MSDMDTADGCACALCGEDAETTAVVIYHATPVPLCGDCADLHVHTCPRCERQLLTEDGRRVFSTPDIYCGSCETELTIALADAALRSDIQRDDMNERRR